MRLFKPSRPAAEYLCLYPLVYGRPRIPTRWQRLGCILFNHRWTRSGRDCARCGRCRCLLFLEQTNPATARLLRKRRQEFIDVFADY